MMTFQNLIIVFILFLVASCKKNYKHFETISSKGTATLRILTNNNYWHKWMPGEKQQNNTYLYNGHIIEVVKAMYTQLDVKITKGNEVTTGAIQFGYNNNKQQFVQWINTSNNNAAGNEIGEILIKNIATTLNSNKNIYGFEPKMERTKDANLLVKKTLLNHFPTHEEIYKIVDELTAYAKSQNAVIQNNPLLNIHSEDSINYQLMVAIVTEKETKENNEIKYKRLVDGNILTANVIGGLQTIKNGELELKNYINDFQSTSPAIPFQELVTHRLNEKDSTKWITKLYYPVLY